MIHFLRITMPTLVLTGVGSIVMLAMEIWP